MVGARNAALMCAAAGVGIGLVLILRRRGLRRTIEPPAVEELPQSSGRLSTSRSKSTENKREDAALGYAAFVSHFKAECAAEARLLQLELEARFERDVFLDSDDLCDLRSLQDNVKSSDVIVLLQSATSERTCGV